ncbi:MAG: HAMP domain-containing histidine kinase [Ruminococcus sp.]|nr:HAMP domain-containing histidine kinase [Ruminococcus sp.]
MDKIKGKKLFGSLIRYLILCFAVCVVGIFAIEYITQYLQQWYAASFLNVYTGEKIDLRFITDMSTVPDNFWVYKAIAWGRIFAIPLWSVLCLWFAVNRYYHSEIKAPLDTLTKAAEKILSDDLDFKVESKSSNELGQLCVSFEEMRQNLHDSSYRLWKSLEERKRLNSAFSHDLRTPITVLKGYMELIERFDGKLSAEKQGEILKKMSAQINRLEHYTEKMSSIHKLEDIIPDVREITSGKLLSMLDEQGHILCGDTVFRLNSDIDHGTVLYTDIELVMQIFLNLISNSLRFTKSCVECSAELSDDYFYLTVSDDGCGFSEEAIRKAWQPFYRGEDENDKEHFGLGLYICWLLCRKLGGELKVENNDNGGGKVTAGFFIKNIEENQKIR